MKVSQEILKHILLFQEGSMSIKKIEESIVWLNDLKKRAEEGEEEAFVDYVKYKKDGLPKRFFDKWAFSYEKMKKFSEENKIEIKEINSPDEPPYFIINYESGIYSKKGYEAIETINKKIERLTYN
jgi:hypothetical protein